MIRSEALDVLNLKLQAMPPVAAMGIVAQRFEGEKLRLGAPLAANVNDKDCAFGGSLASLMTLAGWGWLVLKLGDASVAADVYVADSQIRYLAPLYRDLIGEAQLGPDQDWPVILQCLRERQRARATMSARVVDAGGALVATMTARFALLVAPAPGSRVA